jgi:RNA polymerase sigma-70 factor (ECF subfamily)
MSKSDDELIARCKNGDMSAFDLIVQRNKVPLINFIYRFVGDQETAEDLAQETFIRIYKNARRYRSDMAGFRTWMYRIAANLCKNELRSRNRRSRILVSSAIGDQDNSSDPIENAMDPSAGPDRQMEEKELQKVLTQAISCLPDRLRTVLILRDVEGMPYEEISRIINRPVGTVKSRLNRARLVLKDKMAAYILS